MPRTPSEPEKRISSEFQHRLIELMSDEECSKSELAAKAQISVSVLTRAEIYAIIPSVKVLVKIAGCFEVSLPYLLGETDKRDFYPAEEATSFHERLQKLVEEKKTNYSRIASVMPFSKNFFYEWQRTKTLPSLDYLKALAETPKIFAEFPNFFLKLLNLKCPSPLISERCFSWTIKLT